MSRCPGATVRELTSTRKRCDYSRRILLRIVTCLSYLLTILTDKSDNPSLTLSLAVIYLRFGRAVLTRLQSVPLRLTDADVVMMYVATDGCYVMLRMLLRLYSDSTTCYSRTSSFFL